MKPIFLIGFMAAGKTTLGRALAGRLQLPFIDTDSAIETTRGMSVSRIFATQGEAEFRRAEASLLADIASRPEAAVVACGGGTPCHGDNMDRMLAAGTVVWLRTDEHTTLRRLALAPGQRPLVDGKSPDELQQYIRQTSEARAPYYARAHAVFDSSRLEDAAQIDTAVDNFITLLIKQHTDASTDTP